MKIPLVIIVLILCFSSCKENTESKTESKKEQTNTKNYLSNYIDSLKVEHSLIENPMIVFDGIPIGYENMKDGWFSIEKNEIYNIEYIEKRESKIYGSKGKFGVLLLTTRKSQLKKLDISSIHEINRIYILDGKIVSEEFIKHFDRNKIQGVKIITDQNKISEYSKDEFAELVKISTKKRLK